MTGTAMALKLTCLKECRYLCYQLKANQVRTILEELVNQDPNNWTAT